MFSAHKTVLFTLCLYLSLQKHYFGLTESDGRKMWVEWRKLKNYNERYIWYKNKQLKCVSGSSSTNWQHLFGSTKLCRWDLCHKINCNYFLELFDLKHMTLFFSMPHNVHAFVKQTSILWAKQNTNINGGDNYQSWTGCFEIIEKRNNNNRHALS